MEGATQNRPREGAEGLRRSARGGLDWAETKTAVAPPPLKGEGGVGGGLSLNFVRGQLGVGEPTQKKPESETGSPEKNPGRQINRGRGEKTAARAKKTTD